MNEEQVHEEQVRKLRENVYGHVDDTGWRSVREQWMKPENVKFLLEQPQNKQLQNKGQP